TVTSLPNGSRVATCTAAVFPSVSIGVWVGTGGRYEALSNNGISHFLEHLVFKGSARYSYLEIKELIEGAGGALNGFTSEEVTCFYAKTLRENFAVAFDVLMDMTFQPLVKQQDVEKERAVIVEEIKMYQDLPQHVVYDRLLSLLWPDHPLGWNLAGTVASLSGIGRAQIIGHHRRWYQPGNILITACGDCEHQAAVRAAAQFFKRAGLLRRENPFLPGQYPAAPEFRRPPRTDVTIKAIEQTHFCLGMHGLSRTDPLRQALTLLHIILGANMSSRLFNEIRERRGLAYEIGTSLKRFNDCGALIVHAGVVSERLAQAVELTVRELDKCRRRLVPDAELRRAKDYYIGQLVMGLEDNGDHMLWFGEQLMTMQKIKNVRRLIRDVRAVGAADVRRAARLVVQPENIQLTVIGPVSGGQESCLRRFMERCF
ncbi:MAG: insulinase family protein, partial [Candidatus Omnitrophica bacterium]|nr:insulinase family protein [Candidatus Omnitrophota bacterium]